MGGDPAFDARFAPNVQQLPTSDDGQPFSQPLQTTERLALPHTFGQTDFNQQGMGEEMLPIAPNGVAHVRTNSLSSTGMTFSVPAQAQSREQGFPLNHQSQQHNGAVGVAPLLVAPNDGQMEFQQYCLPAAEVPPAQQNNANAKPCRIQGCDEPAVSRRPYCVKHSGNRMCEHAGCSKCAQGSTRFCIAHGGGRRCTFPGCDKGARDKFYCAAHGGGKRCKFEGCRKSAVGGSSLCTAHGGGRRCSVQGCDKSAQSSTKFCVKHGGGKKCSYDGCEKVARGKTNFCAAHGGGVRCKLAGCNRVAIGKHQLCRSHGGGTRPRAPKKASGDPDDLETLGELPSETPDRKSVV